MEKRWNDVWIHFVSPKGGCSIRVPFQNLNHFSLKLRKFMRSCPLLHFFASNAVSSRPLTSEGRLTLWKLLFLCTFILFHLVTFPKFLMSLAIWEIYVEIWRSAHTLKVAILLELPEKLLGVRSCLGTWPRAYVSLYSVPVLAKQSEAFQELVMLLISPLTFVVLSINLMWWFRAILTKYTPRSYFRA